MEHLKNEGNRQEIICHQISKTTTTTPKRIPLEGVAVSSGCWYGMPGLSMAPSAFFRIDALINKGYIQYNLSQFNQETASAFTNLAPSFFISSRACCTDPSMSMPRMASSIT